MPFNKKIICLTISRKIGGKCVAGKEETTGRWIRPVSRFETEELYSSHITCENGKQVDKLDVVEIPFLEEVPKVYQPENMLIDDTKKWKIVNSYEKNDSILDALCDNPETLFANSTDRVSLEYLEENPISNSLLFVKPEKISFSKKRSVTGKLQVRANIIYNEENYNLSVTDIDFESAIKSYKEMDMLDEIEVIQGNTYLCVSLGEPFRGDCYKLVASVIFGENVKSKKVSLLDKLGL